MAAAYRSAAAASTRPRPWNAVGSTFAARFIDGTLSGPEEGTCRHRPPRASVGGCLHRVPGSLQMMRRVTATGREIAQPDNESRLLAGGAVRAGRIRRAQCALSRSSTARTTRISSWGSQGFGHTRSAGDVVGELAERLQPVFGLQDAE